MAYYSGEPTLANLATGDNWRNAANWDGTYDAGGYPKLAAGDRVWRVLTPPSSVMSGQGTTIVCTWEGTADVQVGGERGPGKALDHGYE
ncbi:hypothetical protein, partial [Sphingomonas metalli]|uniref:hypothetical protein n=1 Tax=Sphingomonas metalli TaxID=1779358 RepID=UPI00166620A7